MLLELARETALAAADLIAGMRAEGVEVTATKSTATDVVTAADRAAEELIRERIVAARPDDGFLGEEGGASRPGTSGVRWVVDPIDGTVNFLYGIPAYAVSIAAEVDGRVRAGVVVDAARGEVWSATRGGGSHRDGQRLAVPAPGPLEEWLVRTGFGYAASLRTAQAVAVGRMLPQVRDIRRIGSCALDVCAIAAGESDGYVEEGVHDWDHAAAGLVLEEAGGRWEVRRGASGGDLLVASGGPGFPAFRDLVVSCGFAG